MNRILRPAIAVSMLMMIIIADAAPAFASDWSEPIVINRRREGTVVSYRAKIESGYVLVEAKHGEGWHTYSMDNVKRAQKKSGKEKPETELPTEIAITGGLTTTGSWYQTTPKDLSMTEIKWYTWGFENTAYFAIKAESITGPQATLTISAQACNASSCSMVDAETITLTLPDSLPKNIADMPSMADKKYVRVGDPDAYKNL